MKFVEFLNIQPKNVLLAGCGRLYSIHSFPLTPDPELGEE